MWSGRIGVIALTELLVFALALPISSMVGHSHNTVRSNSMSPAMSTEDLVVSSSVQDKDVNIGDVMIPCHDRVPIRRRVIAANISQGLIWTKDDANEDPDPFFVDHNGVVGDVGTVVPSVGRTVTFLRGPLGLSVIYALGSLLFLNWTFNDRRTALYEMDEEGAS